MSEARKYRKFTPAQKLELVLASLASDGTSRPNGQIVEITDLLDLASWPTQSRVIVRRERARPGARSCRSPTTTATASRRS